MTKPHGITVRPWVITVLALGVLAVWAVNILAGLVVKAWVPDGGVNAVMAALIGKIGAISGKAFLARNPFSSSPTEPDPEADEPEEVTNR